MKKNSNRSSILRNCAALLLATVFTATAAYAGGGSGGGGGNVTKTFTDLLPPVTSIPGVAPNAHGRAAIQLEQGIKERLKLDIDDVEVNSLVGDPTFCKGFYEAVLSDPIDKTIEYPLPSFAGIIVECVTAGQPQGRTVGSLNFDVRLNRGETAINPRGLLLLIYEVEVLKDAAGIVIVPDNGNPFTIEGRTAAALEGILQ